MKAGQESTLVTFWKFDRTTKNAGEEIEVASEHCAPHLCYYVVFNSQQCEGITVPVQPECHPQEHGRIAACESVLAGMPQHPKIRKDGRQTFYAPMLDFIGMRDLSQFHTAESDNGTLFHEPTDITGHASRLNRKMDAAPAPFGSPDDTREELVAEFGAAFLCAQAGIFPLSRTPAPPTSPVPENSI